MRLGTHTVSGYTFPDILLILCVSNNTNQLTLKARKCKYMYNNIRNTTYLQHIQYVTSVLGKPDKSVYIASG